MAGVRCSLESLAGSYVFLPPRPSPQGNFWSVLSIGEGLWVAEYHQCLEEQSLYFGISSVPVAKTIQMKVTLGWSYLGSCWAGQNAPEQR